MARAKLGVLFEGLAGKVGNVVIVPNPAGAVVRERVRPADPNTSAQQAARSRQAQAARAWSELDPTDVERWRAYAEGLGKRAMNAFTAGAMRVLLVDPAAPIPTLPPEAAFFGDAISVSAAGGAGKATFTGSGPNAEDVVTELLVQKLRSRICRTYLERYRHGAVAAFESPDPSFELGLDKGWYALAYRFIKASTGQCSGLAELGVVQVS